MRLSPTRPIASRALARLQDESGIALVMALGIMFVLAIVLTTTIVFTSASVRHANRSNAGQKAYALAEAGVNNAVAVLNVNYTDSTVFPGDSTLLPARTSTYSGGSVTWSGSLVQTSLGTDWPFEWQITSIANVSNPTGPSAAPVTRTAKAVVPVVIRPREDAGGASVLNYIYSKADMKFEQSVSIDTPVYATGNLTLQNSGSINAAATTVVVGGNLQLDNSSHIGTSAARVPTVYIHGTCNGNPLPCGWDADKVFAAGPLANKGDTTIPSTLLTQIPTLTCCSVPPPVPSSQMGFWYRYASPGPYFPCVTSSVASATTVPPPVFDTNPSPTGLDNSAGSGTPQDLTPNKSYSCTTPGGQISWDASAKKLTINGTVYIDGSAYISTTSGTYDGVGTIVLSGTFLMDAPQKQMCANPTCNAGSWDPNTEALVIVAGGAGAGLLGQEQVGALNSIEIKKGLFQGALIGSSSIDASVTGTQVIGPIISVNGSVHAGQGSGASFPPISFAPSGTGGITSPPPPGMLLSPRNYAGG